MARWGRRGSVPWVYEVIISLLLVALCGYAMFTYINTNARGERFFAKYYAADLGTMADLAAAPGGDVILRYDNLRPDLDLAFWLSNGRVAVGRPNRGATVEAIAGVVAKTPDGPVEPIGASVWRYGPTKEYRPATLDRPSTIILTRSGTAFAIQSDLATKDACPSTVTPQVPFADARVALDITGAATQTERDAIRFSFQGTLAPSRIAIATSPETATITIKLALASGTTTSIDAKPGSADAVAIACDTAQQLRTLTLADITYAAPTVTSDTTVVVDLTLTTSNTDKISPSQIGTAAALAIARRYR